jgi:hypothetical protein
MKLRSTFKIRIVDGSQEAFVTFRKRKRNAALKDDVTATQENKTIEARTEDHIKSVLDLIESVEGFFDESGNPMSVDDIKGCDDAEFLMPIILGYSKGVQEISSVDSAEKKFGGIV